MSSRDSNNQSNYGSYDDEYYDDDVLLDEEWSDEPYEQPQAAPPARPTRTQGAQPFQTTTQAHGTAAELDRLRQAMRRPQATRPQAPARTQASTGQRPATSRPAPGWRPGRQLEPQAEPEWDDPYETSSRAYATAAPASRQRATYQPDPYVDEDQGWDDEYYGDYEDDFSEFDNPRPAPRQRPQVAMPSLSIPPAIANAAIVADRTALGLIGGAVVGLIAMAILTANQVDSLAPGFATHVTASGVLENIRSEGALWNLPIMTTMLTLMAIVIAWFVAPADRFASRFVLGAGLLVQFLAWVALIRLI